MARWPAALGGAALLLAWPAVARAHPHGSLDCALTLQARGAQLDAVELRLTLDAASSQALLPRVRLDHPPAAEPPERQVALFTQVLAGLFRQSGWMLQLRAADAPEPAPATALVNPAPPRLHRTDDERLQLAVRLQPAADAPALPLAGLRIACRDPSWYWLAGFTQPAQIVVAHPGCSVLLGELQGLATQARSLQAAARDAGLPGADQMAPALATASGQRAPEAQLHCPAEPRSAR